MGRRKKIPDGVTIAEPKEVYVRKWGELFGKNYQESDIEAIGDEMVDFFLDHPDSVHISDFAAESHVIRQRVNEFVKRNSYFAFCRQLVRDIVISRALKMGLSTKSNQNVTFIMYLLNNSTEGEFTYRQEVTKQESPLEEKIKSMNKDERKKRIKELSKKLKPELKLVAND